MYNTTYLKHSSGFLIYSSFKFVILTLAAMLFYSGGNLYNPEATHYDFAHNFFSDLGITQTFSGDSNVISFILFIIALVSIGIAMIYHSFAHKVYLHEHQKGRLFHWLASVSLILSGLSFIGIAVLPWNVQFQAHILLVQMAFSLLLVYVLSTLTLQFRNACPRPYIAANLIYLVFLAVYLTILFKGPDIGSIEGLELQAIAQKIIVYASILNLGYQAWGIYSLASQYEARNHQQGQP